MGRLLLCASCLGFRLSALGPSPAAQQRFAGLPGQGGGTCSASSLAHSPTLRARCRSELHTLGYPSAVQSNAAANGEGIGAGNGLASAFPFAPARARTRTAGPTANDGRGRRAMRATTPGMPRACGPSVGRRPKRPAA